MSANVNIMNLWTFMTLIHVTLSVKIALLIIDVQNCFLPGGSLAVTDGEKVIPVINQIRSKYKDDFSLVVLSQDWHCADHVSFASQHAGKSPYQTIQLYYDQEGKLCNSSLTCNIVAHNVTQTLWPDHCVINSTSANFSSSLTREIDDVIIKKGYNCDVDSYSAFFDNGKFDHTELNQLLKSRGITTVFVTGLATDYCVFYTSKDAFNLGYDTYMVKDASKGVAANTVQSALQDMNEIGIHIVKSDEIHDIIHRITSGGISYHKYDHVTLLHVTSIVAIGLITYFTSK